jgi:hypothetical protein
LPPRAAFAEALYVVEIGGDDYFDAFNSLRRSAFVISNLITPVVQKIRNVTEVKDLSPLFDNKETLNPKP